MSVSFIAELSPVYCCLVSYLSKVLPFNTVLHRFDGGASNRDGLFTMEVDYHFGMYSIYSIFSIYSIYDISRPQGWLRH